MSSKAITSAIVTAALFVAAIALNPSAQKHREKIRQATADRHPVAGALGLGALKAFVSNYHSWGVASYTTANERVISVGAFGMVVVLDREPQG
jgi:hypothetical protein